MQLWRIALNHLLYLFFSPLPPFLSLLLLLCPPPSLSPSLSRLLISLISHLLPLYSLLPSPPLSSPLLSSILLLCLPPIPSSCLSSSSQLPHFSSPLLLLPLLLSTSLPSPLASPPLYFPCLSSPSLLLSFLPSCLLTLSPSLSPLLSLQGRGEARCDIQ